MRVYLDTETYSDVDLPKSNVYTYVESPEFRLRILAYAVEDDDPVAVTDETEARWLLSRWIRDQSVTFVAHNAPFDRIVASAVLRLPHGLYLPPERWYDTAALAAEHGYPRQLKALAVALGLSPKDPAGTRLINLFSKPNRKTGQPVSPEDKPEQWEQFCEYARTDVTVLREVAKRLEGWPPGERELWDLDQRINDRGIAADLALAEACRDAAAENAAAARRKIIEITGVSNPNSNPQLLQWFTDAGVPIPNLQARTLEELDEDIPDHVAQVVRLRKVAAVASSNKFDALIRGAGSDHRLRGQFRFHEALTGRWSSKGVQLHNMVRESFEDPLDEAFAICDVLQGRGATPGTLKRLVRSTLIVDGCVSDFSAIEARVLAWLAGEDWVLEAFVAGRDLYVETATRLGPQYDRAAGKITVLACGYQGSVGSMRVMGHDGTDEEILDLVNQWREANPNIVQFWYNLERAFRRGRGTAGRVSVSKDGSDRFIHLPSGRRLAYRDVATGDRLSYAHVQGNRAETYGGKLTENVTQAVARDLLAHAMINLDRAGYPIVAHVHDEVLIEDDDPEGVRAVMKTGPAWATGLPLDASADSLYRYAKK